MRTPYTMPRETICSQRDVESRAVAAVAWLTGASVSGQLLAVGGELESKPQHHHRFKQECQCCGSSLAATARRAGGLMCPPPPGE